ncbi:hypothetical protein LP414_27825 [Polaromonas sp. P1(28)-13]|nr:hypothetical protein LP414_27825 [Polaromonas sp. P1(28)-13]
MSGNIDRIEAQRDMRALSVAVAGQSGEGATQHRKQLNEEVGTIVLVAKVHARDEEGFQALKEMAMQ